MLTEDNFLCLFDPWDTPQQEVGGEVKQDNSVTLRPLLGL